MLCALGCCFCFFPGENVRLDACWCIGCFLRNSDLGVKEQGFPFTTVLGLSCCLPMGPPFIVLSDHPLGVIIRMGEEPEVTSF